MVLYQFFTLVASTCRTTKGSVEGAGVLEVGLASKFVSVIALDIDGRCEN